MEQVHASCIDLEGAGVLIRGPSGSGKSDLALRLIDGGAALVADDRVELRCDGDRLIASAPAEIAGMIEIRGLGVIRMRARPQSRLALVVDLVPPEAIERIPEPEDCTYMGTGMPVLRVAPFEASAPAKIRFALARIAGRVESVA